MPRSKFNIAKMENEKDPMPLLTDDGIPVRTIYVSNLDERTSINDLKKFCEDKFGPVSAVRIHQLKHHNQIPKNVPQGLQLFSLAYAFVTFTNCSSAYQAVSCPKSQLSFKGQQFRINKADSWHQPTETEANDAGSRGSTADNAGPSDAIVSQDVNEKMGITSAQGYSPPLLSINDDCLHEIFKYLNIFDTVNVASTCSRLRYFANENIYQKFVKFEMPPDQILDEDDQPIITLSVLRTMLQHFGSIVQEFDLNGTTFIDRAGRRHLQFVFRYCPNLQTLRLRDFKFEQHDKIALSIVRSKLKVLELHECRGISNEWALMLRKFSKLRTLICNDTDINGHVLGMCKNLESLELIDCESVVGNHLSKFCKANASSLRTLKLLRCKKLENTIFRLISSQLPKIEDLTIDMNNVTGPNQLNCLAELNDLKKLFIVCCMYNIETYIKFLGNRGLLEELTIYGGTLDAETCGTIQQFQRLQTLKLIYPIGENEHMMDIIKSADLPELREFYCEACNSITNANLVALVTSKRKLDTVDILFSNSVTFAAVISIIEVLKSDPSARPHLKLNIDTCEIGDEEIKILNDNRELITVTNLKKCTKLDEYYPDNVLDDMYDMYDYDDDYDIDDIDDSDDYDNDDYDNDDYDIDEFAFGVDDDAN